MPGQPLNAAVLGDTLWVTVQTPPSFADRSLVPIDIATGVVGPAVAMVEIPYGIAAIDDELWVTFDDVDQIGRVDVSSGGVELVEGFSRPIDLLQVDDDIWVTMSEANNEIAVVDPELMQIRKLVPAGFIPWKAATGMGSVWVINVGIGTEPGTVSRFNATTNNAEEQQDPITLGNAPIEIAIGGGKVYIANLGSASVSVLGPAPG